MDAMKDRAIRVFFYGSYMNPAVLAEAGWGARRFDVCNREGFDIHIGPLANLIRSPGHGIYGLLTQATHAELHCLYRHAADVLGAVYSPEAILVTGTDGICAAALCYIAPF